MNREQQLDLFCKQAIELTTQAAEPSVALINIDGHCGVITHCEDREEVAMAIMRPLNSLLEDVAANKDVDEAATLIQTLMLCMAGSLTAVCEHHNVSGKKFVAYMMNLERALHDEDVLLTATEIANMDMFAVPREDIEL